MIRTQRFSLIFFMLVLCSTFQLQNDFVRCIGSDGHDKIEVSSSGNCTACFSTDTENSVIQVMAVLNACVSCIDIPISSHEGQLTQKKGASRISRNIVFYQENFYSIISSLKNAALVFTPLNDVVPNALALQLRTIRLLI